MQNNHDIDDPFEIDEESPESAAESAVAGHREFAVGEDDRGQRLDRFIAVQLPEISRTHVQNLIDEGRVFVGGIAKKPSHRLETGETVNIEIPAPVLPGVAAEDIPLDVLYEDQDVVVLNKPSGMIVHPGAGEDTGTLVAALLHRYGAGGLSQIGGVIRPGIVHRLDKDTSGAMIIARNDEAHEKLVEEFRERRVEKTYVALLHGAIKGEKGRIELPVSRDMKRRSRMAARRAPTGACACASSNFRWSKPICIPAARTRSAYTFPRSVFRWWVTRFTALRGRNGLAGNFCRRSNATSCTPPASH